MTKKKKKVKKGLNRRDTVTKISKRLLYYQKNKYKTKKAARDAARVILDKLNANNQKPIIKNIWLYSRKRRVKKNLAPVLPDFLRQPQPYFTLLEYDYWIKRCPNNIYFESLISPSTMETIQGGETIDVEEYFYDFVKFCNVLKSQTDPNESRYIDEWQVLCTEPVLINGKWTSTIICTNEEGEQTNYGFDPDKPTAMPREPMPPRKEKPVEEKKLPPDTPSEIKPPVKPSNGDRAKEIRLTIEGYTQLYRDNLLTKKEYLELVTDLNKQFIKGGNI